MLEDRRVQGINLLNRALPINFEVVSRCCLFLTSSSSNLKARKYMARYNPLRLFHAASELSKPCQTFVPVCFYLSTNRGIFQGKGRVLTLRAKSYEEPQDISISLRRRHPSHPSFFVELTFHLRDYPRSNAHWFQKDY